MFQILYYLLLLLLSVFLVIWFLYFLVALSTYKKLPHLKKEEKTDISLPKISIIIPSRNEKQRIINCLQSLKKQTYPDFDVLIIDDSTDETTDLIKKEIGKDKKFKLIKQEKLPNGWIGKSFAMYQASKIAQGEYFLFIDADTFYEPELVEKAVEHTIKNKLDLLSLIPKQICKTFWEKVIQPIPLGFLLVLSPIAKVNDPKSKAVIAYGPFMLIKKTAYQSVGGYETIKGQITDDAEMAKLLKNQGFKIGIADSNGLMKLRMYEKLGDIWEGWSKNIFLGFVQKREINKTAQKLILVLFGIIGIFGIFIFSFLTAILTGSYYILTTSILARNLMIYSLGIWLFSILIQGYIQRKYSIGKAKYSIFTFLGGIIILGIFLNSAVRSMSGKGVKWKGRVYSTKKK